MIGLPCQKQGTGQQQYRHQAFHHPESRIEKTAQRNFNSVCCLRDNRNLAVSEKGIPLSQGGPCCVVKAGEHFSELQRLSG